LLRRAPSDRISFDLKSRLPETANRAGHLPSVTSNQRSVGFGLTSSFVKIAFSAVLRERVSSSTLTRMRNCRARDK
jgi:hypothetical protein